MRLLIKVLVSAALIVGLTATEGRADHDRSRPLLGALVGAGLGALAGSAIGKGSGNKVAIGAGTFFGTLFGAQVGRRAHAEPAYPPVDHAAPVGYEYHGAGVVYRPRAYEPAPPRYAPAPAAPYCREFYTTVVVGGRPQQLYGTACRQADGSWEVVR